MSHDSPEMSNDKEQFSFLDKNTEKADTKREVAQADSGPLTERKALAAVHLAASLEEAQAQLAAYTKTLSHLNNFQNPYTSESVGNVKFDGTQYTIIKDSGGINRIELQPNRNYERTLKQLESNQIFEDMFQYIVHGGYSDVKLTIEDVQAFYKDKPNTEHYFLKASLAEFLNDIKITGNIKKYNEYNAATIDFVKTLYPEFK